MAYRPISRDSPSRAEEESVFKKPLGPVTRMPPPLADGSLGPLVQLPDGLFQFSHFANPGPKPDGFPPPPGRALHPPHRMHDGGPFRPIFSDRGPPFEQGRGPGFGRDWHERDGFVRPPFSGPPFNHFGEERQDWSFPGRRAEGPGQRGEADRFDTFRPSNWVGGHSWRYDAPQDRVSDRGRSASSERGRSSKTGGDSPGRVLGGRERHPSESRGSSAEGSDRQEKGKHARETGRFERSTQGGPASSWRDRRDERAGNKSLGSAEGSGPAERGRRGQKSLSEAIQSAQEKVSNSASQKSRHPRKSVDEKSVKEGDGGRTWDQAGQEGSAKVESRGAKSEGTRVAASSPRRKSPSPRPAPGVHDKTNEGAGVGRAGGSKSEAAKSRRQDVPIHVGRAEVDSRSNKGGNQEEQRGESKKRVAQSEPRHKDSPSQQDAQREDARVEHRDSRRAFQEEGAGLRSRLVKREVAGRMVYDFEEKPSREREKTRRGSGGRDAERADGRKERQGERASNTEIAGSRDKDRREEKRHEASRQRTQESSRKDVGPTQSGKREGSRKFGVAEVSEKSRSDREGRSGLFKGGSKGKDEGPPTASVVGGERRQVACDEKSQKREREMVQQLERREKRRLVKGYAPAGQNLQRSSSDMRADFQQPPLASPGLLHSRYPSGSSQSAFTLFGKRIEQSTVPRGGWNLSVGKGEKKMQIDGPAETPLFDQSLEEDPQLSPVADVPVPLPLFEVKPAEPLSMSHLRHEAVRVFGTTLSLPSGGMSYDRPDPTLNSHFWPSSEALVRPSRTDCKATQTYVEDFPAASLVRRLMALEAHPLYRECFTDMPKKDPTRAHWAVNFGLDLGGCSHKQTASNLGDTFRVSESVARSEKGGPVQASDTVNLATEAGRGPNSRQNDGRPTHSGAKRASQWPGNLEHEGQPRKVRRIEEDPPAAIWQDEVPAGKTSTQAPVAVSGPYQRGSADRVVNQNIVPKVEDAEAEGSFDDDGFWDTYPGPSDAGRFPRTDCNVGPVPSAATVSAQKSAGLARGVSPADEDIPLKFLASRQARAKQRAVKGSATETKPGLSLRAGTAVIEQTALQDKVDLTEDGSKEDPRAGKETREGEQIPPGEAPAVRNEPQCALCGKGPSLARGDWYCANCGRQDDTCTCARPLRAHNKWKRKYAIKYSGPKAVVHKLCAFWTPSVYQPGDGKAFVGLKKAVIDSTGSPNHGGKKLSPVRCTFCNEVGATSRCRVESTCHSVYHYTCAVAAGCRMHDCLEDQGLSVACPDHFHVGFQVRKGTGVPRRQLPWTATKGGAKRQKPTSPQSGRRVAEKVLSTVPAKKSTIRKIWREPEELEGEDKTLIGFMNGVQGNCLGGLPGAGEGVLVHLPEMLAIETGKARRRGVTPFTEGALSPGAMSPAGKKSLGNRELRSILADVPKPKEVPSEAVVEEQQRKKREKLLASKQATIQKERAGLLEELSADARLRALVRTWAPAVYRLMGGLREGAGNRGAKQDEENGKKGGKALKLEGGKKDRTEQARDGKEGGTRKQDVVNGRKSPGQEGNGDECYGNEETLQEQGESPADDGVNKLLERKRVGRKGLDGDWEGGGRSRGNGCRRGGTEDVREEASRSLNNRTPDREGLSSGLRSGDEETRPGYDETDVEAGDESTGTAGTELVQPVEFNFDSDGETVELAGADEEGTTGEDDAEVVGGGARGLVECMSNAREDRKDDLLRGPVEDFECAACGTTGASSNMERHPALPAILCADCMESFNSADFSDQCNYDVERHCQLCGRKAKRRPKCDNCCKTICQRCLERVLGAKQQAAIEHLINWRCFACDLTQLKRLAAEVGRLRDAKKVGKMEAGVDGRGTRGAAVSKGAFGGNWNRGGASQGRDCHPREGGLNRPLKSNTVKGDGTVSGGLKLRTEQVDKSAPGRPATSLLVSLPEAATSDAGVLPSPRTPSPSRNGAETYACTSGGCSKVFLSPQARNGHLSKHAGPQAHKVGPSEQPERNSPFGGRGSSLEDEEPERNMFTKVLEKSSHAVVEGTTDGCGASGGGFEEAKGESSGTAGEASACAACGVSLGTDALRSHARLPVGVCKECEERYNGADFTNKDVRGWERACQLCGRVAVAVERSQCEGLECRHSTCASCIGRVLRNKSLYLSGELPWLCFACDVERIEDAYLANRGSPGVLQPEPVAERGSDLELNGTAENGDKGGDEKRRKVSTKTAAVLGKRSHSAVSEVVSENWGFCQCDRCADRYTGKKEAQSPGPKKLSPGLPATRKSGARPWAAYSRVGSRLVHDDLSGGKDKEPTPFTNDVDDDVSALEIDYITDLRLHPDLADFHERFEPAAGCAGCCSSNADDPGAPPNKHVQDLALFDGYPLRTRDDDRRVDWQQEKMEGRLFYDQNGHLLLPPDAHPTIIECNPRCPCWPHCPNATLQRGSSVHLEVFKTENGRGFGVRTREDIQRGRLIGRYVGEVITSEEANRRSSVYLFNMDHHVRSADQHDEIYVIDGGPASSVIRYINHSCDPNLAVYSVYADTLHPGKPCLALYAIKDIVAGTELAYDYKYGDPGQADSDSKIECRCGAAKCQLWLPDPTGIKSESQE